MCHVNNTSALTTQQAKDLEHCKRLIQSGIEENIGIVLAGLDTWASVAKPYVQGFLKLNDWLLGYDKGFEGDNEEIVSKLVNMELLDIGGSHLKSIPKELGMLVNLKMLYIGYNHLQSIPKELGMLVNLEWLGMRYNQLQSIPKELGALVNLERLDVASNNLKSIPKELGMLVNLERLNLVNNQLQSIPSEVSALRELGVYITL